MLMLQACAYEIAAGNQSAAKKRCLDAVQSWVDGGLAFALAPDGTRLFDPAEVICFMRWSGANGQDRFWEDEWVRTARAFVTDMSDRTGDARFHIALKRTFDLSRFEPDARLRLRLPLPLRSAYHTEINITPLVNPDWASTQSDGRLEVRMTVPADRTVTIGADIDLVTTSRSSTPPPLDQAERELHLRAAEDLIRVTPRIEALATHIAGVAAGRAAVDAFWAYLMETLHIGAIRYDEIVPETAIENMLDGGWCDCQLGSSLFIALCRARGLPARLVGGNFLYPLAPTKHYWAEVWLDDEGWLPFDCSCWDLSLGGRDMEWRDRFAGRIDARLVMECFPRHFTGPMSVRFPAKWQMVQTASGAGIATQFNDISDGSLVYRDEVTVNQFDEVPSAET